MGAKYVVFTSKHHEGFALHDSRVTDFDGKDFTGRDLFREIVTALRAEGLRVGVYYSVIDWHHPDFPVKNTGLPHPLQHERNKNIADPDAGRVMSRYVDYLHQQVDEIVSNYGPLDVLWWDWSSEKTQGVHADLYGFPKKTFPRESVFALGRFRYSVFTRCALIQNVPNQRNKTAVRVYMSK